MGDVEGLAMRSTPVRTSVREPSPPAREDSGEGSGWKLLTVARDHLTAHLIEGRLAEDGIETFLDKSNPALGAFLKPFGDPLAPVKIYVKDFDFAAASLVLHEVDHVSPDPDSPGPRAVRGMFIVTIVVIAIAVMMMLIEIFDFAPCFIGFLCF